MLIEFTGGASGIGLAAAKILSSRGTKIYILDITPLDSADVEADPDLIFRSCDVTSWVELRSTFQAIGHVDLVFANAGIGETTNYFIDTLDDNGLLQEPLPTE